MKKKTAKKRPSNNPDGRPPLLGVRGKRYQIYLPPDVADLLRAYGAGSLSQGIVRKAKGLPAKEVPGISRGLFFPLADEFIKSPPVDKPAAGDASECVG